LPTTKSISAHPAGSIETSSTRSSPGRHVQTQWARNLRAAGEGDLLLGRRRERVRIAELADSEKEPILRACLRRWKWEVGQFFGGVEPDSPAAEPERIAPDHPVFRIES
jgi:hypothetical protein